MHTYSTSAIKNTLWYDTAIVIAVFFMLGLPGCESYIKARSEDTLRKIRSNVRSNLAPVDEATMTLKQPTGSVITYPAFVAWAKSPLGTTVTYTHTATRVSPPDTGTHENRVNHERSSTGWTTIKTLVYKDEQIIVLDTQLTNYHTRTEGEKVRTGTESKSFLHSLYPEKAETVMDTIARPTGRQTSSKIAGVREHRVEILEGDSNVKGASVSIELKTSLGIPGHVVERKERTIGPDGAGNIQIERVSDIDYGDGTVKDKKVFIHNNWNFNYWATWPTGTYRIDEDSNSSYNTVNRNMVCTKLVALTSNVAVLQKASTYGVAGGELGPPIVVHPVYASRTADGGNNVITIKTMLIDGVNREVEVRAGDNLTYYCSDTVPGGTIKKVDAGNGSERTLKSHGKETGVRNAKEILLSTQ